MKVISLEQALEILDDRRQSIEKREAAARYLEHNPAPKALGRLVVALQDGDFGVRWAAAEALAQLGPEVLPPLLHALTDPDRVGDPRLRESIYHVIHRAKNLPVSTESLRKALKGPGADIATIREAGRLLLELDAKKLV